MHVLRAFLNGLTRLQQDTFAQRCGTTVGYLRKVLSTGQAIGAELCINIERESLGAVPCESMRPDVDWAVLRNSQPNPPPAPASQALAAINSEAKEAAHG